MRVRRYGGEILLSEGMQRMRTFQQHGTTTVFAHCVHVACMSLLIAERLHVRVDERAMVRGALLHDYFLYDWHVPAKWHRLHGFHHAARACRNAKRDFSLNAVEENMIRAHMFPLGIVVPRYRESWILWTADKICALRETLRR